MPFKKGDSTIQSKPKKIKPNLNNKSGKVWMADRLGTLNPGEVARAAGVRTSNLPAMRNTDNYAALTETYAGSLMKITTLDKLAELTLRNAEQNKDVGGSNNAIRMALEKIEPDNRPQGNQIVKVVFE